ASVDRKEAGRSCVAFHRSREIVALQRPPGVRSAKSSNEEQQQYRSPHQDQKDGRDFHPFEGNPFAQKGKTFNSRTQPISLAAAANTGVCICRRPSALSRAPVPP